MHPQPSAGPTRTRRIFVLMILTAGLFALLTVTGPTSAQAGGNRFAAIAVNRNDNTAGWSFNYATRAGAERRALRECRIRQTEPGCRGIVWVRNGCAAVAVRQRRDGSLSRITWGVGATREIAQRRAKAKCQSDGRSCFIRAWACSG
jgi:hypothetical protein